jgi:hypothetical protein
MEHHEFWSKIEALLKNYEQTYTAMRWFGGWGGLTKGREGYFVFLRFAFLIGIYTASFYLPFPDWVRISVALIAAYLIADMFMLPTSMAFGGVVDMRPLRALVLVFINYLSISMAYGVLYVTLCRTSFNVPPDLIDLAYFSISTMTTLGTGDIFPARHANLLKLLVGSEVLAGLYYLAVLVGMIISWTAREAPSPRKE